MVNSHAESGLPPWHTIVFLLSVSALCIGGLPTFDSLDEIAKEETFLNVVFPEYFSPIGVAIIRLLFGMVMLFDACYQFLFGYWDQDTEYHSRSKLKPVPKVPFRGYFYSKSIFRASLTLSYFTYWVWVLEGFTFVLTGSIPIAILWFDMVIPPWALRLGVLCWGVAAPGTMLVSSVVKYVLWPLALENEDPTNAKLLKSPVALIEHNLNFIAAISEVAFLGGLPIRYTGLTFTLIYGLVYVVFSFTVCHQWTDKRHGPQFIYPFLDPTLGYLTTAFLFALLMVLAFYHVLFCWIDHFLTETLGGGLVTHVTAVLALTALVCRFRD